MFYFCPAISTSMACCSPVASCGCTPWTDTSPPGHRGQSPPPRAPGGQNKFKIIFSRKRFVFKADLQVVGYLHCCPCIEARAATHQQPLPPRQLVTRVERVLVLEIIMQTFDCPYLTSFLP